MGGSVDFEERPTITYSPLSGQDFARRLLKTVPIEVIFALGQSGWSTDNLFRIAVHRFGDAENMSFAHIGSEQLFRAEAEKLEVFDRVIQLQSIALHHAEPGTDASANRWQR